MSRDRQGPSIRPLDDRHEVGPPHVVQLARLAVVLRAQRGRCGRGLEFEAFKVLVARSIEDLVEVMPGCPTGVEAVHELTHDVIMALTTRTVLCRRPQACRLVVDACLNPNIAALVLICRIADTPTGGG